MYYSYDEAIYRSITEVIRAWTCERVFASETFLCSCCKGRVFLFDWISTVVDTNLSTS